MSSSHGPIYEITLSVDRQIIGAFDEWLAGHVQSMLDLPGFVKAEIFLLDDDEQGRARRVTHYYLENDSALENYLAGPAQQMRQAGIDRFAEKFEASRRILRPSDVGDAEHRPLQHCLNCGYALAGQYCGNCGQRARSRLISIWELVRDAFGDLFELDSRLWRTLVPLLVRPGQLTRDYLLGRRARYMPPFRMYLVLSLLFFLVAFFDPRDNLGILYEPEAPVKEEEEADGDPSAGELRQEIIDELAAEGILVGDAADEALDELAEGADGGPHLNISTDGAGCDVSDIESADLPEWLAKRLTVERLTAVCERIQADDGSSFLNKLLDNVPSALFILLPLMALVLKILYPLSKRYYVEHLLFAVHYHAFVFLLLTLQIIVSRLGQRVSLPEDVIDVVLFASSLFVPVYLYKAIRRVYEQGHAISLVKFFMLLLAYFLGFGFILAFAAVFAAFSI